MAACWETARPTTSSAAPPATPRRSPTPKPWLVSALIVLAGCGASEEDRVRDVVASYRHEVADGDFDAACERLARAPHSCAERMEEARHRLDEDAIERLHEAEVSDVRLRGDTATARADEETFDLRRIDGEWRVE